MELLILYVPMVGALVCGLFGRYISVVMVNCSCVLISAVVSVVSLVMVERSAATTIVEYDWLYLCPFGVKFDTNCLMMCSVVSIVSLLVHVYSWYYMQGDPHVNRFFVYLTLFTVMMLIMVCADNLLLFFAGWEGVGLMSFLLIHFWFTRIMANMSGMKAFFINRLGDYSLFLLILVCMSCLSSCNIDLIGTIGMDKWFYMFVLIAAIAKSAQFGLHIWLPSAMEGPTPVSALLHAATMVTAGVYLLLRMECLTIGIYIGCITAVYGAVSGMLEYDMKRIIAYSTTSQIGYMFASLVYSDLSLYHLVNHASFKALLFLTAGSFIHSMLDEQDLRKYGGIFVYLPRPMYLMVIGSMSLMAFPFTTGFFSKDLILEMMWCNKFVFSLLLVAAIFTSLYSIRLLLFGMLVEPMFSRSVSHKICDNNSVFAWIPLLVLSVLSVVLGYVLSNVMYIVVDGVFVALIVKIILLMPMIFIMLLV